MLCITNDFGPRAGGIESFVIGLIARAPHGSIIVYTSEQGDTTEYDRQWLKDYGVEVIRDRSNILLPTLRVSGNVKRLARERNIEVAFFGAAAPLGLLARGLGRSGVKNIFALTHGHEVWWSKLWPFSWALRFIASQINHLTYLGEFTRSQISPAISKKSAQAMIKLAPGIDTEHFAPTQEGAQLRSELGLANKKIIISVGRLVHRKGQDVLIKALPALLLKHPDSHLLLIGEGPYREHLESLVSKLNLQESVNFIGRIQYSQLPKYFCVGDVFAMPSRSRLAGLEVEGLGIVYLEASACKLPVIAGKSGGAPDAIVEGITGVTVDGRDTAEVTQALQKMFDDPTKARAMGEAGREWIIENWRWEIWSQIFNSLLKVTQKL